MREVVIAVVLIAVLVFPLVGCGNAEDKAYKESMKEMEQTAREVLPLLYQLRELEKTPGAEPAEISNLKSRIAEKIPGMVTGIDENGKGTFNTEDTIEFQEGLLEELSSTPKKK